MSAPRAGKTRSASGPQDTSRLAEVMDGEWEDARQPGGPVAVVVLGFGFLAFFALVALLAGFSAVASFLIGWVASLSGIVLAVIYGGWRDYRRGMVPRPRDRDDHIAVWDADLGAERARTAKTAEWDEDMIIDAVPVGRREA